MTTSAELAVPRADGLEAMKLPRAELDATKEEIREIRAEFAPATNGAPAGPLPDSVDSAKSLAPPSLDSTAAKAEQ